MGRVSCNLDWSYASSVSGCSAVRPSGRRWARVEHWIVGQRADLPLLGTCLGLMRVMLKRRCEEWLDDRRKIWIKTSLGLGFVLMHATKDPSWSYWSRLVFLWFDLRRSKLFVAFYRSVCPGPQMHRDLASVVLCARHPVSMHEARSGKPSGKTREGSWWRGRLEGEAGLRQRGPAIRPTDPAAESEPEIARGASPCKWLAGWLAGSPKKQAPLLRESTSLCYSDARHVSCVVHGSCKTWARTSRHFQGPFCVSGLICRCAWVDSEVQVVSRSRWFKRL